MAVTIQIPTQTSSGNWRVDYSSSLSDPTFFIYRDGILVNTTNQTYFSFLVKGGDSPVIEIKDSATDIPKEGFPGRLILTWFSTPATSHYRIEEFVNAVWTFRQNVSEDGRGYYKWQTRFLEDEASHQFRIIPVGTNENDGTIESFVVLMVRHPDVPDVNYTYSDSTKKLTITEV